MSVNAAQIRAGPRRRRLHFHPSQLQRSERIFSRWERLKCLGHKRTKFSGPNARPRWQLIRVDGVVPEGIGRRRADRKADRRRCCHIPGHPSPTHPDLCGHAEERVRSGSQFSGANDTIRAQQPMPIASKYSPRERLRDRSVSDCFHCLAFQLPPGCIA